MGARCSCCCCHKRHVVVVCRTVNRHFCVLATVVMMSSRAGKGTLLLCHKELEREREKREGKGCTWARYRGVLSHKRDHQHCRVRERKKRKKKRDHEDNVCAMHVWRVYVLYVLTTCSLPERERSSSSRRCYSYLLCLCVRVLLLLLCVYACYTRITNTHVLHTHTHTCVVLQLYISLALIGILLAS